MKHLSSDNGRNNSLQIKEEARRARLDQGTSSRGEVAGCFVPSTRRRALLASLIGVYIFDERRRFEPVQPTGS